MVLESNRCRFGIDLIISGHRHYQELLMPGETSKTAGSTQVPVCWKIGVVWSRGRRILLGSGLRLCNHHLRWRWRNHFGPWRSWVFLSRGMGWWRCRGTPDLKGDDDAYGFFVAGTWRFGWGNWFCAWWEVWVGSLQNLSTASLLSFGQIDALCFYARLRGSKICRTKDLFLSKSSRLGRNELPCELPTSDLWVRQGSTWERFHTRGDFGALQLEVSDCLFFCSQLLILVNWCTAGMIMDDLWVSLSFF